MRKSVKTFLAGELIHYADNLAEKKKLQAKYEFMARCSNPDQLKLLEIRSRLAMLNHILIAIETLAIQCSQDPDHTLYKILELAYMKRSMSDWSIIKKLYLSRAQYYRSKRRILIMLAKIVGLDY